MKSPGRGPLRRGSSGHRNGSFQRNGSFRNDNNLKIKMRGNPNQMLSKYLILAKNALTAGDRIQAEYYFQFADHYSRVAIESGMEVNLLKSEDSESLVEKDSIDKDITENNLKDKEIVDEKNVEELEDQNENTLDSVAFLKK